MPLEPGKLRTRLDLHVPVRIRDAQGGATPVQWAYAWSMSARIMPATDPTKAQDYKRIKTGMDKSFAGSMVGIEEHLIYFRVISNLTVNSSMRLVNNLTGQCLNITSAQIPCMIRREVRVFATENCNTPQSPRPQFVCVTDHLGNFIIDHNGSFVVATNNN